MMLECMNPKRGIGVSNFNGSSDPDILQDKSWGGKDWERGYWMRAWYMYSQSIYAAQQSHPRRVRLLQAPLLLLVPPLALLLGGHALLPLCRQLGRVLVSQRSCVGGPLRLQSLKLSSATAQSLYTKQGQYVIGWVQSLYTK